MSPQVWSSQPKKEFGFTGDPFRQGETKLLEFATELLCNAVGLPVISKPMEIQIIQTV